MAVTLRYFTEVGKAALQKTICGGIYARVYCTFSACTMSSQRKFTFAISSPDEFLVLYSRRFTASSSSSSMLLLRVYYYQNTVSTSRSINYLFDGPHDGDVYICRTVVPDLLVVRSRVWSRADRRSAAGTRPTQEHNELCHWNDGRTEHAGPSPGCYPRHWMRRSTSTLHSTSTTSVLWLILLRFVLDSFFSASASA